MPTGHKLPYTAAQLAHFLAGFNFPTVEKLERSRETVSVLTPSAMCRSISAVIAERRT